MVQQAPFAWVLLLHLNSGPLPPSRYSFFLDFFNFPVSSFLFLRLSPHAEGPCDSIKTFFILSWQGVTQTQNFTSIFILISPKFPSSVPDPLFIPGPPGQQCLASYPGHPAGSLSRVKNQIHLFPGKLLISSAFRAEAATTFVGVGKKERSGLKVIPGEPGGLHTSYAGVCRENWA